MPFFLDVCDTREGISGDGFGNRLDAACWSMTPEGTGGAGIGCVMAFIWFSLGIGITFSFYLFDERVESSPISLFIPLLTSFGKSSSRTFSCSILSIKSSFFGFKVSDYFGGSPGTIPTSTEVVFEIIDWVGVFSIYLTTFSILFLLSFDICFFGPLLPLLEFGNFLFYGGDVI